MMTLTPTAQEKIRELMQGEKDMIGLRVYVKGVAVMATSTGCRLNPQ